MLKSSTSNVKSLISHIKLFTYKVPLLIVLEESMKILKFYT